MKTWLNPIFNIFWCVLCSPFVYYALKQEANAGDASYYWLAIVVLPVLVNRYYYILLGTLLAIPVSSYLGQMKLADTPIFYNFGPVGLVARLALLFGVLQLLLYALKSYGWRFVMRLLDKRQGRDVWYRTNGGEANHEGDPSDQAPSESLPKRIG